MSVAPSVAAVVVNWNLPDLTLACVDSLTGSAYANLEIIVVDSGSDPACVAQLQRAAGSRYRLISLPDNVMFAAAANVGIQAALAGSVEYVLLINNDAVAAPEMLPLLVAEAEAHPHIGIVAPLIFYADAPTEIWRCGDRERPWLGIPQALWRDVPASSAPAHPINVDYVTGCGMLLRRKLLEDIGSFDERFIMYYEDADLCLRARRAGYGIRVVPTARIWHKVSQSARINRPKIGALWARSRVLFYRHKASGLQRLIITTFLLWTGARLIATELLRGQPQLARAFVQGFVAGCFAR